MTPRARWFATVAASVVAGGAIHASGGPLPWMIGPILAFAAANTVHAGLHVPRAFRYAGQVLVGVALGLYFTAAVLAQVWGLLGWIALATALSLCAGFVASRVLMRVGRVDPVTAFFASTVGGAAEMANQAERHGARVDCVLILLCLGSASAVAWLSGIPWATMALATAPGGLAEMGLTAKLLRLGVPVVTAFHIVRLAVVVTTAAPGFRLLRRLAPSSPR